MLRNAESEERNTMQGRETRVKCKAGLLMDTDTFCMLHGYVSKEDNLVRMLQHHRQMNDESKDRSSAGHRSDDLTILI